MRPVLLADLIERLQSPDRFHSHLRLELRAYLPLPAFAHAITLPRWQLKPLSQNRGPLYFFGPKDQSDPTCLSSFLREVVIGPCAYPEVSKVNVQALLEAKGYKQARIVSSKIPFRSV